MACGADINFRSHFIGSSGMQVTPLMRAAINGNIDIVKILVILGADRDVEIDGETARTQAYNANHISVYTFLRDN